MKKFVNEVIKAVVGAVTMLGLILLVNVICEYVSIPDWGCYTIFGVLTYISLKMAELASWIYKHTEKRREERKQEEIEQIAQRVVEILKKES